MRCGNWAATNPSAIIRRVPNPAGSAAILRLFVPRRTKHASRSNHDNASANAASHAVDDSRLDERVAERVDDRHRLRDRRR